MDEEEKVYIWGDPNGDGKENNLASMTNLHSDEDLLKNYGSKPNGVKEKRSFIFKKFRVTKAQRTVLKLLIAIVLVWVSWLTIDIYVYKKVDQVSVHTPSSTISFVTRGAGGNNGDIEISVKRIGKKLDIKIKEWKSETNSSNSTTNTAKVQYTSIDVKNATVVIVGVPWWSFI